MGGRAKDRITRLLKHRPTSGLAIEVAPYFNPLLAKRDGHKVLTLDVFDTESLRRLAVDDPNIPAGEETRIEEVDLVGDASDIAALVRARGITEPITFVASSHNFEHLPNPIRFLRGVEELLEPGGVLSMAIPDCRVTFDHFRMPVRLSDWLLAYHQGRSAPGPETIFDAWANIAVLGPEAKPHYSGNWQKTDPSAFRFHGDLRACYAEWLERAELPAPPYRDAHVSPLFGAIFELMIAELRELGLLSFEVIEISETTGHEFFAHLRRPLRDSAGLSPLTPARRQELARRVVEGMGARAFPSRNKAWYSPRRLAERLFGAGRIEKLRAWNRKRRGREV